MSEERLGKRIYLISFFLLEYLISYLETLETELDLNEQLKATFKRLSLTGKP